MKKIPKSIIGFSTEIVSTMASGLVIGYGVDYIWHTKPYGLVIGGIFSVFFTLTRIYSLFKNNS